MRDAIIEPPRDTLGQSQRFSGNQFRNAGLPPAANEFASAGEGEHLSAKGVVSQP
jgi:hypothetical protein